MKSIKIVLLFQAVIILLWLKSYATFIAFEVAWLSSLLVVLGSMYSYKKLVSKRLEHYEGDLEADLIEKIDDPYDLYSEEVVTQGDDARDIKAVIQEEKARLKANKTNGIKAGGGAAVSLYRIVPYLFLVMGFMALHNNGYLELIPYLMGLGVGIVSAMLLSKQLFNR